MKALDAKLNESEFVCGDRISIADIIIYNDISQYMAMCFYELDSPEIANYPNLVKWITNKMKLYPLLNDLDNDMRTALRETFIGLRKMPTE